jgi:hypothetical protein
MNPSMIEAFPLHWPPGRKRTQFRKRAVFHRRIAGERWTTKEKLTIADGRDRTKKELGMLGAKRVIISSNLRLKQDGEPMSAQREPDDPGIAVYFHLNNLPHCLSCDSWDRAADNLAAIAKHVEAMRGQLRWGVADIASMFAGFKALPGAIVTPAAMTPTEAAHFVAKHSDVTWSVILESETWFEAAYRQSVKRLHPDVNGGAESPDWHSLQSAQQSLRSHFQN